MKRCLRVKVNGTGEEKQTNPQFSTQRRSAVSEGLSLHRAHGWGLTTQSGAGGGVGEDGNLH